jgi:Cys-tRNA(Pro)/Cys-tRNA(Cys) deacylase
MKLPAHEYLDRNHIPYEVQSFPDTTEKGAANVAKILGLTESQVVKTLIFETDKGERALIMVAANQNAISGLLKKALGSRNISLAKPEVVVEVTGYVIGSIPPFHWQPDNFSTIVDEALMREPVLGVGAGVWGNEILIEPQHLVSASKARVVKLTERELPGEPPVVA